MHIAETYVQVRYSETDQMGIVYHANYFIWFEVGRTALIEELGFSYADMEADGIVSPVIDIHASFKKPVTYGGKARIQTWIESYDGLRVVYGYNIYNDKGALCVTGDSTHICVRKEDFRPVLIKRTHPKWHEVYEEAKKSK